MLRGPRLRSVARKPDKRGLKAGLPRLHVWKAGIHVRVNSLSWARNAAVYSSTDSYTRSAARAAAISLATIGGSHVPRRGPARHEYRCRCCVPCAAAHGAQFRAGRGDASGDRKGSGGSHSSSGNGSDSGGGRVVPLLSGAVEVAPAVLSEDGFTSTACQ